VAFDFLEGLASTPVTAANMRAELGAAWEYALDAARLDENVPNWWRQVMRGRLRSKGKVREGKHVGTARRVLTEAELARLVPWLGNFSELVRDVLTLYLWTCARGAEILAMEAGEISDEADGRWWTCPKRKTKNARHANATDLRVPLVGRGVSVCGRQRDGALAAKWHSVCSALAPALQQDPAAHRARALAGVALVSARLAPHGAHAAIGDGVP
jgi:integrase